ncbi:MAG: hypothetical protein E7296_01595 [Lachnospiraceae bacterium]|jgi:hypothetical protein|nr:hypothetical protein [Lachnospiraceae bacterium]
MSKKYLTYTVHNESFKESKVEKLSFLLAESYLILDEMDWRAAPYDIGNGAMKMKANLSSGIFKLIREDLIEVRETLDSLYSEFDERRAFMMDCEAQMDSSDFSQKVKYRVEEIHLVEGFIKVFKRMKIAYDFLEKNNLGDRARQIPDISIMTRIENDKIINTTKPEGRMVYVEPFIVLNTKLLEEWLKEIE